MKNILIYAAVAILCFTLPIVGSAQDPAGAAQWKPRTFTLEEMFTFLFLTLGPLKILGRFAALTRGHDANFRKRLAFISSVIAMAAVLLATTLGAMVLMKWHISRGAITLTAGVLLTLIALQAIMQQYGLRQSDTPENPDTAPTVSQLAYSPLAFPTIVTPYGIALLILLATIAHHRIPEILGLTAAIFVLNLLTMLAAERIMKWPLAVALFGILGAVVGVLQIALGIQTTINGLHFVANAPVP